MNKKKWFLLPLLVVAFVMLMAACQAAAPEPTEVMEEPTDVVVEPTEEEMEEPTETAVEPTEEEMEEPTEEAMEEPTDEPAAADSAELDVYRIAILADITSSNVWNLFGPGASAYNYVIQNAYWPTLFGLSHQRLDLIPQMAADFPSDLEQEGDFWVSTVPLKEGVLWSDGSEITAEDIVFTSEVVMDFGFSGNWTYSEGDLDHIEAVDPYTVKLYYSNKPGLAVHQYGVLQDAIVQKAYWEPLLADAYAKLDELEDMDEESDEYIAGQAEAQQIAYGILADGEPIFGPFAFQRWEVGAFVENIANDSHYFDGIVVEEYENGAYREFYPSGEYEFTAYGLAEGETTLSFEYGPHVRSVVYSVYNQDAAVLALLNGDVDYIYNPSGYGPGLRAQLEGNSNVSMTENPRNGFRFMAFNFRSSPLDDIAVRQAITCMIDKDFLTSNILQGAAFPVYTPVPEGLAYWYNPDVTRLCAGLTEQERMEWAVALLKEAGYSWDVEPTWNEARGGSIEWGEGLKKPDGSYVEELLLLAPSPGYDPLRATSGVLIEQWAGMIGFPVTAKLTNFNNILNETLGGGGNWDMAISGWSLTSYPDHVCDFFLEEYGGPFAFMAYESEEHTALCREFKAATDLEEARALNYQLQESLAVELPYAYLFANPVQDAYNLAAVDFPYTSVLDGIEGVYGLQELVNAPE